MRAQPRAEVRAEGLQRDWLAFEGAVGKPDSGRPQRLIVDDDGLAIRLLCAKKKALER